MTVSHELRTPLTAIYGWARMLGTEADRATTSDAARSRRSSATRSAQTQLIDDLLDVSRAITGKLRLDVRAGRLADVVPRRVETISPAVGGEGHPARDDHRSGRRRRSLGDPRAPAAGRAGTCCRTRSSSRPRAAACGCGCARPTRTSRSSSPTPARASPPSSCPTSSIASARARRGTRAALRRARPRAGDRAPPRRAARRHRAAPRAKGRARARRSA